MEMENDSITLSLYGPHLGPSVSYVTWGESLWNSC